MEMSLRIGCTLIMLLESTLPTRACMHGCLTSHTCVCCCRGQGRLRVMMKQMFIINEIFVMRLSKTNAAKAHCS